MKAFVTGSTGLLGNNLVRALLAQGHEVKALARSQRKAEQLLGDTAAQIVVGDMDDVAAFADELEGCDVLFHGAAFFREYYQPGDHWATLKRINVDAVIEIFEAAEARGVRRAIFVSSSGTVGVGPNGTPGDETAPPPAIAADNLYFRSKVLADEAVAAWLPGRKLEVVTILPGWMYGPYDAAPTSSGQLVLDFLHRKLPAIIPGAGSVVDARDVAQAHDRRRHTRAERRALSHRRPVAHAGGDHRLPGGGERGAGAALLHAVPDCALRRLDRRNRRPPAQPDYAHDDQRHPHTPAQSRL